MEEDFGVFGIFLILAALGALGYGVYYVITNSGDQCFFGLVGSGCDNSTTNPLSQIGEDVSSQIDAIAGISPDSVAGGNTYVQSLLTTIESPFAALGSIFGIGQNAATDGGN
jgi:hypothetical protein